MREVDRIADQLQRVITGEAWHGQSLHELLVGIDGTDACSQPPGATHSIHDVVLHITVWLDVVRRRLDGEQYQPAPHQDWPTADSGQLAWSDTLRGLDVAATNLQEKLLSLSDVDLAKGVSGKAYDVYQMLHGVIQHTAYHTGQIALLRRLI